MQARELSEQIMKNKAWYRVPLLICVPVLLLAACSMEPVINHQVIDYYRVNDEAATQVMLLNILRAKDGLPLHFSELSQIRGQLAASAAVSATIPFGMQTGATTRPRNLVTPGVTVSSSPSFDITSLDTKDFTDGVMAPIAPKTLGFFMDEGIDYRMVLMLLASGIRQAGSDERLLNAPDSSRMVCFPNRKSPLPVNAMPNPEEPDAQYTIVGRDQPCAGWSEPEFYTFLRVLNNIGLVYAVSVQQFPKPIGPPFALDMHKDLASITRIDPKKYTLDRLPSGQYQLMSLSSDTVVVLCHATRSGPQVMTVLSGSGDGPEEVPAGLCDLKQNFAGGSNAAMGTQDRAAFVHIGTSPGTAVLKLRSTLEVIQYLGQILAFQQEHHCITVEYESLPTGPGMEQGLNCSSTAEQSFGTLFRLVHSSNSSDASPISVAYGGQRWFVPPLPECGQTLHCDHTRQTLAIVSLLLDQNKSVEDLPRTPAVQTVP
jgi:hypothetical protein